VPRDIWGAVDELRAHSLGRLLHRAFRRYHDAALESVRSKGHPELTLGHSMVLPHIEREGSRLTEIAERAGMTKQSASEVIGTLAELGYVKRAPDPLDRRAQRITFTRKGEQFLLAAHEAKAARELEMDERLGAAGAKQLVRLLQKYVRD